MKPTRRPAATAGSRRRRRRAQPARPPPPHAARARRARARRDGRAHAKDKLRRRSRPPPATSTATSAARARRRGCPRAHRPRPAACSPGRAVGAKQATELQHELDTLARRQTVLEDEQLEVMEQREAVGADLEHAACAARRRPSRTVIDDRPSAATRALADIDAARARPRPRPRRGWPTSFPPTCWPPTRSGAQQRGVGAALLQARRCQSCRLELDRTAICAAHGRAADEVVHCEECGVILVRTRSRACDGRR